MPCYIIYILYSPRSIRFLVRYIYHYTLYTHSTGFDVCMCMCMGKKKNGILRTLFLFIYFIFFLIFHRATSDRQSLKIGNKTKSLIYLLRIVPRLYNSPGLIILSHPPGRSFAISLLIPISLPPSERAKSQDAFLGGSAVLTMLNVIIFFSQCIYNSPRQPS